MAQAEDTLGIIVNSDRYFDFVTHLAEAAAEHDKFVHIHLVGAGCQFAVTDACLQLTERAQITMCAKSSQRMEQMFGQEIKARIHLVPPQGLTKLLNQCALHVVF